MSELQSAAKFFVEQLATIGVPVYNGFPQEVTYPCVVFNYSAGSDINGGGATRIATTPRYRVRVVGEGGFEELDSIVDAMDSALHGQRLEISGGGQVLSCLREEPFQIEETLPGGKKLFHSGGMYRVMITNN